MEPAGRRREPAPLDAGGNRDGGHRKRPDTAIRKKGGKTNMKTTFIVLATLVLCGLLLLGLVGCGASFVCDECGQERTGKAYYGMSGEDVMCEDCARDYWMPLDYTQFRWDRIPR